MRMHAIARRQGTARAGTMMAASLLVLALLGVGDVRADHVPVHGTILARGPFTDRVDLKVKAVVGGQRDVVQVHDAADTIVQQVTVQPGGFTGWHSHPGPAVVVVQEGTFTYYDGEDRSCTPYPYGPGETFVDLGQGHVHSARNEGTQVVQVYVMYFDVPAAVANPFISADDPGFCEF